MGQRKESEINYILDMQGLEEELILEKVVLFKISDDLTEQIFDILINDFSKMALSFYQKASCTPKQMEYALKMVKKPVVDAAREERVWNDHVFALKDSYTMNN